MKLLDTRHISRAVTTLLMVVAAVVPSAAARAQSNTGDAGLAVEGTIAEYTVTPGQAISHKMKVSLGPGAAPLELMVDARGLGQAPDGATVALTAADDTNPYSAREFITDIDHAHFELQPGGTQSVEATIAVPPDVHSGMRYADIYIHSAPSGSGRVGVVLATHIPVLLTIDGSSFTEQGSITRVDVPRVESGKPIEVTTVFQNTGARHFRADAVVTLKDQSGKQVGQQTVPLEGSSMLPGFPHSYKAAFSFLDRVDGLPAGTYTAESQVVLVDGRPVDTKTTNFLVSAAYQPFPDIDPESLVVVKFNDEEPRTIDARLKADVQLSFVDTGKVSGTVVIGRFKREPAATPGASAATNDGGLGKPALKHWGIGVQGFSRGLAQVTLFYRDGELPDVLANTLFAGFKPAGEPRWSRLDNQNVFPNAQNLRGDIGVAILNGNPLFALASSPAVAAAAVQPDLLALYGGYWPFAVLVLLVLSVGPSLVLLRRGRK